MAFYLYIGNSGINEIKNLLLNNTTTVEYFFHDPNEGALVLSLAPFYLNPLLTRKKSVLCQR